MSDFETEEIESNTALQLYTLPNSEDCNVVKTSIYSLGVPFTEHDATEGGVMRELEEIQGNGEVPFLYNTKTKEKLSGRDTIKEFIEERFAEGAVGNIM